MMTELVEETTTRVSQSTPDRINARIRRQLEANIVYYARRLDQIEHRINELDTEWDIERTLQTNAGVVALAGITLGLFWRKWLVLPIVVGGFLVQHALQGWCPPVELFRRMGIRTASEISHERYALKALRGDFDEIHSTSDEDVISKAGKAIQAAELDSQHT